MLTLCNLSGAAAMLCGVGLFVAELPFVESALAQGSRADKMGIVGILTALLLLSVGGNVWMMRALITRLIALIEKAMPLLEESSKSIDKLHEAAGALSRSVEDCRTQRGLR